ncbi:ABC transporter permease subunit [Candidatus Berkiella aquae]|uniref:ABC transporter permease subunit n=2 Tax=Candidatus Berkiella aquae TaxID=295108 RepID=A0AAE3L836_9GAMM|nr:ABC transporter permease subunit [Candidatus Berkiella aquae]MCS5710520.1 ABC transporter permease subunit [Candidatus Berkiella aquae]
MRHLLDKLSHLKTLIPQLILVALIVWVFNHIAQNVHANLAARGVKIGFAFLNDTAGFDIIFHLIDYATINNYWQVFWVGILNTLLVAALGIFFASLFGFIVGFGRVSRNKIIALCSKGFVETIRNIPLLLQLFFWYFVVLRGAPFPQDSITIVESIYINNRGLYLPWPIITLYAAVLFTLSVVCILISLYLRHSKRTWRSYSIAIWLALAVIFFAIAHTELTWEYPTLGKFNFVGGMNLIPEFLALVLALSTYTAAYIAEIVRMGIQSVSKGQYEAARSLGFAHYQSLRLIMLPQAMKVIVPPLTNQYLNLTKNSSLAAAIAFPDLVSVFAGTVLNQTGHAIEIIAMTMGVYLFISLCLSLIMILYERRSAWHSP